MENSKIIKKIDLFYPSTKEVLDILLSDSIIEMRYRNRVNQDVLKRISLVYLSLFDNKNLLEYDELNRPEKNLICRIISKGIASIYVDDEYITDDNYKDKLVIIDDMINLLCFLTQFSRASIKRLVIKDIKKYFYYGWDWDFIKLPY